MAGLPSKEQCEPKKLQVSGRLTIFWISGMRAWSRLSPVGGEARQSSAPLMHGMALA